MSNDLRLAILLSAFILYFVIFITFKRGRMPLKFSLVWLLPTTVVFAVGVIPDSLIWIMNILGFQTLSNMIIGILFIFLFFVCISLTIIVSGQKTKIVLLVQELSILKEKVNELDRKK